MKSRMVFMGIAAGLLLVAAAGYLGYISSRLKAVPETEKPSTVAANICNVQQTISAPGMVVNTDETTLQLPIDGVLDKINVQPGQAVKSGDVLATLQKDEVALAKSALNVADARKKLSEAEKKLAEYKNYISVSEVIDISRGNLILAENRLKDAEYQYNCTLEMSENDSVRAQALIDLNKARLDLEKKKHELAVAQGIKPTDVAVALAQANVDMAKANLQKAQNDLEYLQEGEITAPFDSVLIKNEAEVNKSYSAGAKLFVIHNPKEIEIQSTVLEEDLPYVSVGQDVELYFDALPEYQITGKVNRIVPERASTDRPIFYVYISLDSKPDQLINGMTADASIIVEQKANVLCLPRTVVRASSGDLANVYVWNGSDSENREIEIGLRGDVNVEVLSGLKEGEEVVIQ